MKKYCANIQNDSDTSTHINCDEALNVLIEYFPDCDPDFLKHRIQDRSPTTNYLQQIINEVLENEAYPKLEDYHRRQSLSTQIKKYTSDFTVADFVALFPQPLTTFEDPQMKINLDLVSEMYAKNFLRNRFPLLPVVVIKNVFKTSEGRIFLADTKLEKLMEDCSLWLKRPRKKIALGENVTSIPLLQEIAFVTHKDEILDYIRKLERNARKSQKRAKATHSLYTCQCCYTDNLISSEVFKCTKGCLLCKQCVRRSCEGKLAEGSCDSACVLRCEGGGQLPMTLLQGTLDPGLFSKFTLKQAAAEIKASQIVGLECCPFCDFMYIPAEGDKLFHCLNAECLSKSCRQCKKPNHVPLGCGDIEHDADVKARVFIENKMSEALMRQCYKCSIKFLKEDGCNKMTCNCGAQMCYVCKQPVKDYSHFNRPGDNQYHLCPLFSDTDTVHKLDVLKEAEKAKRSLGNVKIKNDPTSNTIEYFNALTIRKMSQVRQN